jgi:predicted NBD/HSP70 family sugar kinase
VYSIDIGVKYLAIIVIDVNTKEIKYWAINEVREINGTFSQSISSLMELALQFMTETVVVVIEKQI